MITPRQIADLHIEQMSGGDQSKDSKLSYQMIIPRIRHLLNDFIKPLILERYNEDDRTPPTNFVVTHELLIQNDPLGAYVDIPDWYLSLPHNKGIHRVVVRQPSGTQPGTFEETECTPTQFPQLSRNTRAGRYPTLQIYYIEGQRLRLQNMSAEPGAETNVLVQIISGAPESVKDNDNLPLSPEMVSQILQKLLTFTFVVPQDKTNNQISNA